MDDAAQGLHRRAWDLIPWVVNGSASAADTKFVADHVAVCPDCRDELMFHRRLQTGIVDAAAEPHDAEPALARLWSQIERIEGDAGNVTEAAQKLPSDRRVPAGPARWTRWLAAAVVAQAVGLGALGGILWGRDHDPRPGAYETLSMPRASTSPDDAASIRLVPSPTVSMIELRALLERHRLRLVEANGDATILGLALQPGSRVATADLLARLRSEPGVLLAEPVQADRPAGR